MDDEKARAAYHPEEPPGSDPLPVRDPWASFAQHGAPPESPLRHAAPGERPWASPGRPPWDNQVHQDLAVQHGWPTPGQPKSSTVAVWALITGVVGVLAGWCLLGLPCIAAVVLGHVALSQTKDGRMTGRGMAVAGLVLGYVALIPALIFCLYAVIGVGGAAVTPPVTPSPYPWPSAS
jgi:hypothetical protein